MPIDIQTDSQFKFSLAFIPIQLGIGYFLGKIFTTNSTKVGVNFAAIALLTTCLLKINQDRSEKKFDALQSQECHRFYKTNVLQLKNTHDKLNKIIYASAFVLLCYRLRKIEFKTPYLIKLFKEISIKSLNITKNFIQNKLVKPLFFGIIFTTITLTAYKITRINLPCFFNKNEKLFV